MIAERIETNEVDIQTKRLYKRYAARKQQDYERRKEVRAHFHQTRHSLLAMFHLFVFPHLFMQWNRIILAEPQTSCAKSSDDSQQHDVKDAAAEFEVQANQTIVDKYRSLKLFKQQMTEMKRNFNEKILKLQHEKHTACEQLSEKIEKFRQNYKKLYANDKDIDVDTFAENVLYFDGKSFKVERLQFTYLFFFSVYIGTVCYVLERSFLFSCDLSVNNSRNMKQMFKFCERNRCHWMMYPTR